MGHRIAIMRDGVLQQVGPPQEVYERPANLFVAGFIGTPPMNTIAGRRSYRTATALAVALPGAGVAAARRARSTRSDATGVDDVVIGVRPEHLCSRADGVAPGHGRASSSRSATSATSSAGSTTARW